MQNALSARGPFRTNVFVSARTDVWRNTSASKSGSHTDIATNIDAWSVATNCAWADEGLKLDQTPRSGIVLKIIAMVVAHIAFWYLLNYMVILNVIGLCEARSKVVRTVVRSELPPFS
jgi:hypothetical protein